MATPDTERTAALAAAFAVGYSTAFGAVEQLKAARPTHGVTDDVLRTALAAGFNAGLTDTKDTTDGA